MIKKNKKKNNVFIELLLVILIVSGFAARLFRISDWDSGALLHPDEYGMANTVSILSFPKNINNYFNTRESSISPYNKYDINGAKIGDGPDNRMRWGQLPMIIIRLVSEATGTAHFGGIRVTGRYLSALMDMLSVLLLFLISQKLFRNRLISLGACALSSLSVMQIQQSHFMTVDNFAVFFSMLTIFQAVKIALGKDIFTLNARGYRIAKRGWIYAGLFGLFLGMTISCKVNLATLGVILALAVFIQIADLPVHSKKEVNSLINQTIIMALFAVFVMAFSFRIFQPMSFRAPTGNTGFFTLSFNRDWMDSMMVASSESSGLGGGPPSEQWAHRLPIVFPLINMIFYGMGFPLGVAAWICMGAAVCAIIKSKNGVWKQLLIPVGWGLFFFLFMGTRFVKSIRYMLPVYPMFCLVAAWGVFRLLSLLKGKKWGKPVSVSLILIIFGGTALWAGTFVQTIYGQDHSRVEAVKWIYQNIPSMIQMSGENLKTGKPLSLPLNSPSSARLERQSPMITIFSSNESVKVNRLTIPYASFSPNAGSEARLDIRIIDEMKAGDALCALDKTISVSEKETALIFELPAFTIQNGGRYRLEITLLEGAQINMRRPMLANESWDEGLPFGMGGYDPFGQLYNGTTNEVRWPDSSGKKDMYLSTLEKADYIFVPSQRSMWSACRIPLTYPMTADYYNALFDGSLGFELIAQFQRPFKIGPFYFSDLIGAISVGKMPELPVKNLSLFAAEEAFSVYDHPPVWIFKKTGAFSLEKANAILSQADLSKVIVQGPKNAVWPKGYNR